MTNQFSRKHDTDVLDFVYVNSHRRSLVDALVEQFRRTPNLCLLPTSESRLIHTTFHGRRVNVTYRSMVYYVVHKKAPIFGAPICMTPGCCNPSHQTTSDDVSVQTLQQRAVDKQERRA